MKIAVILAEFGKPAPDVSQYRGCWPDADIQVFGDADVPRFPQFEGPRYGWRANDYWTIRKALDSGADVAIAVDGDMRIVNMAKMRTLVDLTLRFGICLPLNPRYTVERDCLDGADVTGSVDTAGFYGPSLNCSPVAIDLTNKNGWTGDTDEIGGHSEFAIALAEAYCGEMLERPVRGPLAWWRAMWATGITPLILPPQFCVCDRHIGVGGEICLHYGHEGVRRYYAGVETR